MKQIKGLAFILIAVFLLTGCTAKETDDVENTPVPICTAPPVATNSPTPTDTPTPVPETDASAFCFGLKPDDTVGIYALLDSSLTEVYVPEEIEGKKVTEIVDTCFYGSAVTKVVLPDTINKIGYRAFRGCGNLISIEIPDSVTEIGDQAFYECVSLTGIVLPSGLKKIEDSTFCGCSHLASIALPEGLVEIGAGAFCGCGNLKSIEIPDSVTEIGKEAFLRCTGLESVQIPDSVTEIGELAFYECAGLTGVVLPSGLRKIEDVTFKGCSHLASVTLPDGLVEIGAEAFSECNRLRNIEFPDSVERIGSRAFGGCKCLTFVEIPTGVQNIEGATFEGCAALSKIVIPQGVTSIGNLAFYDCECLKSIEIPNSVISIGMEAFLNCDYLKEIRIPGSVIYLGTDIVDPTKCTIVYDEVQVAEDRIIDEDTTDYRYLKQLSGTKLVVNKTLTIKTGLTVSKDDLDVSKGRLELSFGSTLKMDDVTVTVLKTNDRYSNGSIYLYERNGKLKFTGGKNATVKVTVPEDKTFGDYFEATNLNSDTNIICNGLPVEGVIINPGEELYYCDNGEFLITEDVVLGRFVSSRMFTYPDMGPVYLPATVPYGTTLKVVPGNRLSIPVYAYLYGTLEADREEIHNSTIYLKMENGSKVDLGDVVIKCTTLYRDQGDGHLIFVSRADSVLREKFELQGCENVRLDIELPEGASFEDYFYLSGNKGNVEIYINGNTDPYMNDDIVTRIELGNEKELVVSRNEIVETYMRLPKEKSLIISSNAKLELKKVATIDGRLEFDMGCLLNSQYMWVNPGATIVIDGDVILTCKENVECDELANIAKSIYFVANSKKCRISGYACIVDITMPETKKFEDYFKFEETDPGMIINVNGKRIY